MVLIIRRHIRDYTLKSSSQMITTQKMAKCCQTPLIIVFSWWYRFYQQSDILELFFCNLHLPALRSRKWPICITLSHASKSSLSSNLWCLTPKRHFGAFTVKSWYNAVTFHQKGQFAKFCHTPLNYWSHVLLCSLSSRATFWRSFGKILSSPHYGPKDNQLSFSACVILLIITVTFWCPCGKISLNAITTQKMANFQTALRRL